MQESIRQVHHLSTMSLQVQPATEADARRAVELEAIAYGPNPFTPILFPGPMPASAKDGRAELLAKQLKEDPTTRWHKVVDMALNGEGQMISFVKWHVYTEKPELKPREFGQGCNVEACELLFGGLQKQRTRILGDRPYVCEWIRSTLLLEHGYMSMVF
jgi:hypothetical protein